MSMKANVWMVDRASKTSMKDPAIKSAPHEPALGIVQLLGDVRHNPVMIKCFRTLKQHEANEIGRKFPATVGSPSLKTGITMLCFHKDGIVPHESARL